MVKYTVGAYYGAMVPAAAAEAVNNALALIT